MSQLQQIEPGDRVEYLGNGVSTAWDRPALTGALEVVGHGTVIDVFRGVGGVIEQIFSKPDGAGGVDFRVDFRVPGAQIRTIQPAGTGV